MKHILLFGAGKSATVLIDYLKELSAKHGWTVTVADNDATALAAKVGVHAYTKSVKISVKNEVDRNKLVSEADVVISLLPPALHYLVAISCLHYGRHLLTASYIDERIRLLENEIKDRGLLFLCEMGLDPGIDHMSAMHLIDRIKGSGGKIKSFKSHCGGLVAPESDDNPWHYKISWNPRNIVLAGKAGAIFKENGNIVKLSYEQLFNANNVAEVPGQLPWAWYPNRDSLAYIELYQLQAADTFIRTTLRHPEFCFGWKNMVDLELTDETVKYETDGMTIAGFFKLHFERHDFSDWLTQMLSTRLSFAQDLMNNLMNLIEAEEEVKGKGESYNDNIMMVNEHGELDTIEVEDVKDRAAMAAAAKMNEANVSLKQLFFLGLDSEELINRGRCSAADILEFILTKKMALAPGDKDMVVMLHEIDYELNDKMNTVASHLIVKGDDNVHTAMAKTVGLPLGIAAKLLLEEKLNIRGLHIPVSALVYQPVLAELALLGIQFEERIL